MVFISILIILAGILPFLGGFGVVPSAFVTTPGYQFIIIAVGFISLIYGVMNKMIFGTEKLVLVVIGLITILGGLLPFIQIYIPISIPTSGIVYSGMIILIGVIGFIYGASKMG